MATASTLTIAGWQELLSQIEQRNGSIELYLPHPDNELQPLAPDRTWKVRLLAIDQGDLIVEQPTGIQRIPPQLLNEGQPFHAILANDNHRWLFHTRFRQRINFPLNPTTTCPALRLGPPYDIASAQRRDFYRITTADPDLQPVHLWPLLEPPTAFDAENFNRQMFQLDNLDELAMCQPRLGPSLQARLLDISGGGFLARFEPANQPALDRHDLFWTRLALPRIEHPLFVRAQLARISHNPRPPALLAGFRFVYDGNLRHRHFIEQHVCRFIAYKQRLALQHQH